MQWILFSKFYEYTRRSALKEEIYSTMPNYEYTRGTFYLSIIFNTK